MSWARPDEAPAVKSVILSDDTVAKEDAKRWARDREAKVGARVRIWWTDKSRSNHVRVRAAVVCKDRDGWSASDSHLGTRQMEVYDAKLWAIRLTLHKSVRKWDTLQTHGVTKVDVFRDQQTAIRRTEHLALGPGQYLAMLINQCARNLREAVTETGIHRVSGYTGIPGSEEAEREANLEREGCRAGTVQEQGYT